MIPSATSPEVSIVIPAYGKPELTRQCLESLFAVPAGAGFEVILVDNASPVALGPFLREFEGRIRMLRNETNQGFSRACNQGARAALGRHLMFLNNDTEVRPGWLRPLVAALDGDPGLAMVGSKLLYPNGTIQHAGVLLSRYDAYPHGIAAFHPYRGDLANQPWVNRARELQAVTAACCLVRREVFEALEGFDPAYWNGYEDVDLCFRIGRKGLRIRYEPASVVVHHESMGGKERFARADQNVRLLNLRWGGHVRPDDNHIYLEDGFLTRWTRGPGGVSHDVLEVGLTSLVVWVRDASAAAGLEPCLAALRDHTGLPHELLLACGAGARAFVERMRWPEGLAPAAAVELDPHPVRALNRCLRATRGGHVVLLDAGALVGPRWLHGLLAALADHIEHGAAGPRFDVPPVASTPEGSRMPRAGLSRRARSRERYPQMSRLRAECLALRAEVLERVGELDEGLPPLLAIEDVCLRAAEAGHRLVLADDVVVRLSARPAARLDEGTEHAFAAKWGVTRYEYFIRGHRPLRRLPDEPETGDPGARSLLEGAWAALGAGQVAVAGRALDRLSEDYPELGEVHYLRGLMHYGNGQMDAAAAELALAVRLAPRSERALLHLAEVLRSLGRTQDALGIYGRLLQLRPQDPDVLSGMGDCLAAAGRRDMAHQCFRLAGALAPGDESIRERLRLLECAASLPRDAVPSPRGAGPSSASEALHAG